MSLSCGGRFFRCVCIFLLLADIAIGWYSYHQMRTDIRSFNADEPHTYCTDDRIDRFWKVYVGFESVATVFKVMQIAQLMYELCEDEKQSAACPVFLVVLSYCAEIASALTIILFMQYCECHDLSPSTWTIGKTEMIKKFVSGAGLVAVQLLIHATSIVNKCCTMRRVSKSNKEPGCCMAFFNIILFLAYLCTMGAEIYYAFCGQIDN